MLVMAVVNGDDVHKKNFLMVTYQFIVRELARAYSCADVCWLFQEKVASRRGADHLLPQTDEIAYQLSHLRES
jgi:hypothetical protein